MLDIYILFPIASAALASRLCHRHEDARSCGGRRAAAERESEREREKQRGEMTGRGRIGCDGPRPDCRGVHYFFKVARMCGSSLSRQVAWQIKFNRVLFCIKAYFACTHAPSLTCSCCLLVSPFACLSARLRATAQHGSSACLHAHASNTVQYCILLMH